MLSSVNEEAMTQLYEVAIKVDPDFQSLVTIDDIILSYAPFKIK